MYFYFGPPFSNSCSSITNPPHLNSYLGAASPFPRYPFCCLVKWFTTQRHCQRTLPPGVTSLDAVLVGEPSGDCRTLHMPRSSRYRFVLLRAHFLAPPQRVSKSFFCPPSKITITFWAFSVDLGGELGPSLGEEMNPPSPLLPHALFLFLAGAPSGVLFFHSFFCLSKQGVTFDLHFRSLLLLRSTLLFSVI